MIARTCPACGGWLADRPRYGTVIALRCGDCLMLFVQRINRALADLLSIAA